MGAEEGVVLILDLFAGPGGWDEGCAELTDERILGIETDPSACLTALAAGHPRVRADVSALDPIKYGPCDGFLASPPCQSYSRAGQQKGVADRPLVEGALRLIGAGKDTRAEVAPTLEDPRSLLTVEPIRWIDALRPRWVAMEQVPAVMPLWEVYGDVLLTMDYSVEAGILWSEEYGVPQCRQRAILVARRDGKPARLPEPTHQGYDARKKGPKAGTEHRLPYVTMAQALGRGMAQRPSMTVTGGGSEGTAGGAEPFGRRARENMAEQLEREGGMVGFARNDDGLQEAMEDHDGRMVRRRDLRSTDEPAQAVTSKARSWTMRVNAQSHSAERADDAPAPTIKGGKDFMDRQWIEDRPSTTLQGTDRVARPGHKDEEHRQFDSAVQVSVEEASLLQGFPPAYPWQGVRTRQFEQIGNAVPPPLARAILVELLR